MIKYHNLERNLRIAEILPESEMIYTSEDLLDIMADAGYNGSNGIIVHSRNLNKEFFDLKTGLAGEILQKFSNYRMKLAIVEDFVVIESNSLRDFIRESNSRGIIHFVNSLEEGISRLNK